MHARKLQTNIEIRNHHIHVKLKNSGTYHGLVHIAGVQLHVNLLVDPCLTLGVEVLSWSRCGHFVRIPFRWCLNGAQRCC